MKIKCEICGKKFETDDKDVDLCEECAINVFGVFNGVMEDIFIYDVDKKMEEEE